MVDKKSEMVPPKKGSARKPRFPQDASSLGGDAGANNVGSALRSAFDEIVNEDVPSEMLDLLKKLA